MPAKSKQQLKLIYALRGKYKTKEDAPEKYKWAFDKKWTDNVKMKNLPTYEEFLNESYLNESPMRPGGSMRRPRNIDIAAVSKEIGVKLPTGRITGKRAETMDTKLSDQLRSKGFDEGVLSFAENADTRITTFTNDKYKITLSWHIGMTLRNDSLNVKVESVNESVNEGAQRDMNNLAMYLIDLNKELAAETNPKTIKFIKKDIERVKADLEKIKSKVNEAADPEVLAAIETVKKVKFGSKRKEAMAIVLAAAKAKTGESARTYKQALQFLDLEDL